MGFKRRRDGFYPNLDQVDARAYQETLKSREHAGQAASVQERKINDAFTQPNTAR
jgi:hypothetical protein